jgi:hypothetical protein
MKSLLHSKTFWLAVAQAIAGIYAAAAVVDPTVATLGWVMITKSVVDIVLRLFTTNTVYVK